jgi:Ni/Co efflux regulator RcnB
MKSKAIASLVIASLLGTSVAAFAQPHGPGGPGGHGPQQQRGAQHQPMPAHGGGGHARGPGGAHEAAMGHPGGPIPHSDWRRGDRLPAEYRDRNYVVDDWRGHGLSAPPRGYHWVGVNGDYVLAAVATGVIASILASGAR